MQVLAHNRQSYIFLGVILLCLILFFSRNVYLPLPIEHLNLLPRDFDPLKICPILQSKVLELHSESKSSNVWDSSSFTKSDSSNNNLQANSLYYWNLLDCSKVFSIHDGDELNKSKGSNTNSIVSDSSTPTVVVTTPIFRSTAAESSSSAESSSTIILGRKHHQHPPQNAIHSDASKENSSSSHSYLSQCNELKQTHHVVPGSSWGSLTTELQKLWSTMECDKLVVAVTTESTTSTESLKSIEHISPFQIKQVQEEETVESGFEVHVEKDRRNKVKGVTAGLPQVPQESIDWCFETKAKYHVTPMKSWGKLPLNLIDTWRQRKCDVAFTAVRMSQRPLSTCASSTSTSINGEDKLKTSTQTSSASSTATTTVSSQQQPLIAIMAASTTRKIINPSPDNIALFTYMLPSLIRTIDCGYRYMYVLGYDKGDPFYDSEEGIFKVQKWFKANIELPMKANGISITLKLVKVNNTLKKPGPVFIEMARQAYDTKADYFYRINDDTEMIHHWPSLFIKTLQSLSPPYGVIGPRCDQGNAKILTHDFVHRIHLEIFEMNYYPPALVDWWMDDWISYVYGKSRTFKSNSAKVIHHTGAHGQRYEVDQANGKLLASLIKEGRQKIRKWMLTHAVSEVDLKAFDNDESTPIFTHNDVPTHIGSNTVAT